MADGTQFDAAAPANDLEHLPEVMMAREYQSLVKKLVSKTPIKDYLDRMAVEQPCYLNLVCEDWMQKLESNDTFKYWTDEKIHLYDAMKPSKKYDKFNTYKVDTPFKCIMLGTFYFQRAVQDKCGEKVKDPKRLEYMKDCPPIEHLRKRLGQKIKCTPLHMMNVFPPQCNNQCKKCSNSGLSNYNLFCSNRVRLFDGTTMKGLAFEYMVSNFASRMFTAIIRTKIDSILLTCSTKEFKLAAISDEIIVIPTYATDSTFDTDVDDILRLDYTKPEEIACLQEDVIQALPTSMVRSGEINFSIDVVAQKRKFGSGSGDVAVRRRRDDDDYDAN